MKHLDGRQVKCHCQDLCQFRNYKVPNWPIPIIERESSLNPKNIDCFIGYIIFTIIISVQIYIKHIFAIEIPLQGLLKSLHRLNDHFGNIYINLGDPISLKEHLDRSSDRSVDGFRSTEGLKPLDLQQLTGEQIEKVQSIADYVVTLQQESTVVTITNLLAIVLMESLMRNEALTFDQVID